MTIIGRTDWFHGIADLGFKTDRCRTADRIKPSNPSFLRIRPRGAVQSVQLIAYGRDRSRVFALLFWRRIAVRLLRRRRYIMGAASSLWRVFAGKKQRLGDRAGDQLDDAGMNTSWSR
jgi:hypothetical protein